MSRGRRGYTLVEVMLASSIASVIGAGVLLLTTTVSELYRNQLTISELAGYLDVATYELRRDVWGAVNVCGGPTSGLQCPGALGTPWLALDVPPANFSSSAWGEGDVRYRFVVSGANTSFVRDVWNAATSSWQGTRTIAQYVETANTTLDLSAAPLVTLTLSASETVRGRQYSRRMTVAYRTQVP